MSRTQAIEAHARRRARERYGQAADADTIVAIKRLIRRRLRRSKPGRWGENDAIQLSKKPNGKGRSNWLVTVAGRRYEVIYEAPINTIVTFLTVD